MKEILKAEKLANPVDSFVMVRQLEDRIEEYESETLGNCKCGTPVVRVNGSNQTNNADGTRYRYPGRYDAWCIFRCQKCGSVMMDSFTET